MISPGERSRVFITATELDSLLQTNPDVVILDVRFDPAGRDRRAAYREGHIAGAINVDLATELAGEPNGYSGRRPLPQIHDLQRDARRWGILKTSAVVVYDDNRGLQAGRAWWVLRWAGISNVRLLDGGLAAWIAKGFPVTTDIPLPAPGDVQLVAGNMPVLTADEAGALARSSILIDARGPDAYIGAPVTNGEAPTGHIPGAISAPTTGNLDTAGLFSAADVLGARFDALGVDGEQPVGVYCGGGVAASHQIAALASIGIKAALFPGSWSAWSSDPRRPVATGPTPG